MSPDLSYPIANLSKLLRDRAELDLSPIELAEILWLALQKGEVITGKEEASPSPQPQLPKDTEELPSPSTRFQEPRKSQSQKKAAVVSEPPKTSDKAQEKIQRKGTALPVNIPEAVALRNRREISRSLRPLMRKVPSKLRHEIDEAATVTHIAETKTWNPVVKPEPERWLELAIVVEVTNLLEVWRETIAELCHVMERQGAFRDVRTWQLKSNEQGQLELFLQTASGLKGSARRPKELRDFGGRRMVLFLSDCTSKAWRSGKILDLLGLWSQTNPVTIVQLLPEHYWDRTALNSGYLVALSSRHPGALSQDWRVEGLSPRQRRQYLLEGLKFPVITIQPLAISEWAKALAAIGEQRTTGILLGLKAFQSQEVMSVIPSLTAKQLVRQFRATASDRAQELADRMAVLPVNWSVIRLVQKNWQQEGVDPLQEIVALPLAEIFLSGLISCQSLVNSERLIGSSAKGGKVRQYDFVDGVRDVLLGAIPISEALEVGEEVATAIFRQLPPEVQKRVTADIERRYGESLSYFEAFLIPDLPWGEEARAEIFPFAKVNGEVLRRWGGEYAALAEELEQTSYAANPFELSGFPLIKIGKFEEAIIIIEENSIAVPPGAILQSFEFEVATIEKHLNTRKNIKWLFQESPKNYRMLDAIRDLEEVVWPVKIKSYFKEMAVEDVVLIWVSGKKAGIYALAEIIELLKESEEVPDIDYWIETKVLENGNERPKVRLRFTNKLLEKPLLKEKLKQDDILKDLLIIRNPRLARTKITPDESKRIYESLEELESIVKTEIKEAQYYTEDLGDKVELEMVLIPGGSFWMGTKDEEIERLCKIYEEEWFREESPQHQVNVSTFFIGRYPITQEQWRVVAGWEQIERKLDLDPSYFLGQQNSLELRV